MSPPLRHAVADAKILIGGGETFISSVLIYRKCAQRNICLLHGKKAFKKREPMGVAAPPRTLLIRH